MKIQVTWQFISFSISFIDGVCTVNIIIQNYYWQAFFPPYRLLTFSFIICPGTVHESSMIFPLIFDWKFELAFHFSVPKTSIDYQWIVPFIKGCLSQCPGFKIERDLIFQRLWQGWGLLTLSAFIMAILPKIRSHSHLVMPSAFWLELQRAGKLILAVTWHLASSKRGWGIQPLCHHWTLELILMNSEIEYKRLFIL